MRKRTMAACLAAALAIFAAGACAGGGADADHAPPEKEKEVWVAHFTTPCEGVAPRECLNVREAGESGWKPWYGSIEGFEFEPGTEYHMMVSETRLENPPADASAIHWRLIEVLDQVPVGGTDGDPILRGWRLAAFGPGAELGDEAAAAAIREALEGLEPDREITLGLEEEGRAAGSSGCNRYFGDFRIEYGHQIVQGPMAGTMMACPDAVMKLEGAYLANLGTAKRLFRRDGRLELESDAGVLLVFEPAARSGEAAE